MGQSAADRRAGQDGGQHEDGQHEQAADAEQRERGQAADGGVGVEPGGGQHAELDGGAGRVAAGQAVGDRVAGQPGGDHREPAFRAQRQPLQGKVAGEGDYLGGEGDREPHRVQRRQPSSMPNTIEPTESVNERPIRPASVPVGSADACPWLAVAASRSAESWGTVLVTVSSSVGQGCR
jgi:hypothetical protein